MPGQVSWPPLAGMTRLTALRSSLRAGPGGLGVFAIVYTDIDRDGMLSGVNVAATVALAAAAGVPVIASGGVATLDDVRAFNPRPPGGAGANLMGAITGRAIYAGTLDFRAGQALFDAPAADQEPPAPA